ncbi:single-stranded DNA-binding protein [Bradyrhizobium elkanii]|uniref:single-stranded DNA-binding protein n=1 Tax=Bradyrhizobium elkanii TaxID=29448 RepID=UPI003513AFB5
MKMIGLARLGRDVEVRYTANGDAVANLALAYNYGRKDESGQRPTQWIKASLWGERAEKLAEWLTKGREILVELDDVHGEQYEGQNGVGFNIVARVVNLQFTAGGGDRQDNGGQQQQQQRAPQRGGQQRQAQGQQRNGYADATGRQQPQQQQRQAADLSDMDDDIPF